MKKRKKETEKIRCSRERKRERERETGNIARRETSGNNYRAALPSAAGGSLNAEKKAAAELAGKK